MTKNDKLAAAIHRNSYLRAVANLRRRWPSLREMEALDPDAGTRQWRTYVEGLETNVRGVERWPAEERSTVERRLDELAIRIGPSTVTWFIRSEDMVVAFAGAGFVVFSQPLDALVTVVSDLYISAPEAQTAFCLARNHLNDGDWWEMWTWDLAANQEGARSPVE